MDVSTTHRLALPLLHAGQAQKELFHNEALATIDFLVQPVVTTIDASAPPATPLPGECHIVGVDPTGAWSGAETNLACWTQGGWRFAEPFEGMCVWLAGTGPVRFEAGEWTSGILAGHALVIEGRQVVGPRRAAIDAVMGGSVSDTEARAAISAIIERLVSHGLIAPTIE
ncbi:DUF2793 domain-containing protein [Sphingomonas sp. AX6]|uniref:DUF2793 domain-containing protein n=1 Tax=Sphingomonas sp. AX6 TaxID=2653171 RepID=UPI0012F44800|nr:DUF2793 domain-containing protein [Sphingomonas sp. AX6]VXC68623.1 conserved hypothetical protein [Sphingomonas sp. AX6]